MLSSSNTPARRMANSGRARRDMVQPSDSALAIILSAQPFGCTHLRPGPENGLHPFSSPATGARNISGINIQKRRHSLKQRLACQICAVPKLDRGKTRRGFTLRTAIGRILAAFSGFRSNFRVFLQQKRRSSAPPLIHLRNGPQILPFSTLLWRHHRLYLCGSYLHAPRACSLFSTVRMPLPIANRL